MSKEKALTLDELLDDMNSAVPRLMWQNDNKKARDEDRKKKRGIVILSPDVAEVKFAVCGWSADFAMTGDILSKDGKEYRVHVEEWLRGRLDKDGKPFDGYWVDFMEVPKLSPIIPMSECKSACADPCYECGPF